MLACVMTYRFAPALEAFDAAPFKQVDPRHLREVSGLDLDDHSIASLRPGEFDGPVRMRTLNLPHNLLASLPPGLFDKLYLLTTLGLDIYVLETSPRGRVRRTAAGPRPSASPQSEPLLARRPVRSVLAV